MSKKKCGGPNCQNNCTEGYPACPGCWAALPRDLRLTYECATFPVQTEPENFTVDRSVTTHDAVEDIQAWWALRS